MVNTSPAAFPGPILCHGSSPLQLLPVSSQEEFSSLLQDHFAGLRKHLLHEHKELHKRARRNRQILQSKGELSEERKADNEAAQKAYDKLLTNSSTLAVRVMCVVLIPMLLWELPGNEAGAHSPSSPVAN